MSGWSPPEMPLPWIVGIALLYAVVFGYSVFFLGDVLLGIMFALFTGILYYLWRFVMAVEAIADALQRLAAERE